MLPNPNASVICESGARKKDHALQWDARQRFDCYRPSLPLGLSPNKPAEETLLSQWKPPFRAEHVGSLLRPKALLGKVLRRDASGAVA